ncbi:MAG TPA: hypothetical protein VJX94_08820 [Stellaceae bacterium]|nr:hypothetical protein [Stellaceae bacterium]
MEIPVIVEPLGGDGYRATGAGGLSVGLTAEGATPAEAMDRLVAQVQTRLKAGATLAQLTMAAGTAAWKQDAGYLRDEPLYEPWRRGKGVGSRFCLADAQGQGNVGNVTAPGTSTQTDAEGPK